MDILLIAAMAANRVIGRNGETPWHIPEELRFFKETTMGHPLIMGRKTFTSLPGPLPGRMNIILSRDPSFAPPGTVTAASLKEGLDLCRGRTMVFVIGGAQVFREAMRLASGIILSVLDREVAGDTCFPEISPDLFRETAKERHTGTEPYTVITYRRVSPDSGRGRADVNTAVSIQSCQGRGCRAMSRAGDGLPDRRNGPMRWMSADAQSPADAIFPFKSP